MRGLGEMTATLSGANVMFQREPSEPIRTADKLAKATTFTVQEWLSIIFTLRGDDDLMAALMGACARPGAPPEEMEGFQFVDMGEGAHFWTAVVAGPERYATHWLPDPDAPR